MLRAPYRKALDARIAVKSSRGRLIGQGIAFRNRRKKGQKRSTYRSIVTGPNMTGINPQVYSKLKYTGTISRTSTSGADAFYVWSVNDIFDPDVTGTGTQPLGRDQWANFFNSYRVMGCKATITMKGGGVGVPILIAWGPNPGITGPASTDVACQTRGWRWKLVDPTNDKCRFSFYCRPWINIGISKSRYSDDDLFAAAIGSSPSQRTSCEVALRSADGSSTSTVILAVELVYYVRFFSPVVLAAS